MARHKIDYTVLDVDAEQVRNLDPAYGVIVGDASDPTMLSRIPGTAGAFDLLFSRMVAEHVTTGEAFHRTVYELAAPGAVALHVFPTLYALPFTANKLLPESLSTRALQRFKARPTSKFPAHYSWCVGPSHRQVARLEDIGWQLGQYIGILGHGYYERFPLLNALHERLTRAALKAPKAWMTSFAILELRKPK